MLKTHTPERKEHYHWQASSSQSHAKVRDIDPLNNTSVICPGVVGLERSEALVALDTADPRIAAQVGAVGAVVVQVGVRLLGVALASVRIR
jgi:hypothetical protein